MHVGVLALQGGFSAHVAVLSELGHRTSLVRYCSDLSGIDGLVLPGGESSTQIELLRRIGLWRALDDFVRTDRPVLATCAGLILASREVTQPHQESFGWLDVDVERNAWGRQLDSFEAVGEACGLPLVFIRAPRIVATSGAVEVLETLRAEPVLVRDRNVVGATFHPELTTDPTVARIAFGEGAGAGGADPGSPW